MPLARLEVRKSIPLWAAHPQVPLLWKNPSPPPVNCIKSPYLEVLFELVARLFIYISVIIDSVSVLAFSFVQLVRNGDERFALVSFLNFPIHIARISRMP